jgi:hypothetical protein
MRHILNLVSVLALFSMAACSDCEPDEYEFLGDCRPHNEAFAGTWNAIGSECNGGGQLVGGLEISTGSDNSQIVVAGLVATCYDETRFYMNQTTITDASGTYTLRIEGNISQVASPGIGQGVTQVDQLHYELWRNEGQPDADYCSGNYRR